MKLKREVSVDVYITEALFALLKKKKFKDISITEICKKAGVTRMSFYRNFESKEDIMFKKVRDVTNSFLEESSISYREDSTHNYFVKLFTHMECQKELCTALYKAGLIHLVKDEFDRVFLDVYREEYDHYKSFFLSGGIFNVFLFWFMNDCKEKPEVMAKRLEGILVK